MDVYDFGLGWIEDDNDTMFIDSLRKECTGRGLSFIKINESTLESIASQIRSGRLKIHFYLDLASETETAQF